MHISRISIQNFRNFRNLDLQLDQNAVIVGENKIGKSNLIFALRLVLDPSLPDSARRLRVEDFWDGLRPITGEHFIRITLEFQGWEHDLNQAALLCDALVHPETMTARLTYVFRPRADLDREPLRDSDYEWFIFRGRDEESARSAVRQRLPLNVLPALRDAENSLNQWRTSPIRPLLNRVASEIDQEELRGIAERITAAEQELTLHPHVVELGNEISNQLNTMVGGVQAVDAQLGLNPHKPDLLLRSLRLYIDNGMRPVADASLGSANLLYIALKQLELGLLVRESERDHTFLVIEEPEAHLHPMLQRLVYREFLEVRRHQQVADADDAGGQGRITKIFTTHSPHIVSVTPLRSLVLLKKGLDGSTVGMSTVDLELTPREERDLERYLDVTRGEMLFSRGVLLVEGEAETYLVPVLAKLLGYDFDRLGITVCSVSGTNFHPFLKLLAGVGIPHAVLTDQDPVENGPSLGRVRVFRLFGDAPEQDVGAPEFLEAAASHGFFLNEYTLEVDLFRCGQHAVMLEVIGDLTSNGACAARARDWLADPTTMAPKRLLRDINAIGKGRFAQRLASCLSGDACPPYISRAIQYLVERCR